MKLKQGDLVIVESHDIEHLCNGWQPVKAHRNSKPWRYHFVGWVLKSTKRFITITAAVNGQGGVNSSYRIPISPSVIIRRVK